MAPSTPRPSSSEPRKPLNERKVVKEMTEEEVSNSSRILCSISVACRSALLIGTNHRIPDRDIASQIASASMASFLPR